MTNSPHNTILRLVAGERVTVGELAAVGFYYWCAMRAVQLTLRVMGFEPVDGKL